MENKTGKYLKYAIGEIILVVIGILIALQINNWNENRKLQNQEIKLIQNLYADLNKTYLDLNSAKESNLESIEAFTELQSIVENNLPYSSEFELLFGQIPHWSSPFITASTYNSIQSNNLSLISNEKLKQQIIEVHEVHFNLLVNDHDKYEWGLNQNVVNPFFSKHFMYDDEISLYRAIPNDYEGLKKNMEFLNVLTIITRQRKKGIENFDFIIENLELVLDAIKKELKLH